MLNILAFEKVPDYLAKNGSDFSQYWADYYALIGETIDGYTEALGIAEDMGASHEAEELSSWIMEIHMLFIYLYIMREEYDQGGVTIEDIWNKYEIQKAVDHFLSMNVSIYQLLDVFELTTYELGIGTMKIGDNFEVSQ